MFDAVRNNKRIVQVFLALITLPFAMWGVDSYVRSSGAGDDIASVGGSKITQPEYQQAMREQQEQLKQALGPNFNPEMMNSPSVRKAMLDQLINQRILMLEAKKRGIVVSDAVLADFIASAEPFQEGGKFSLAKYQNFVAQQGKSQPLFEHELRQDLVLRQLAGAVGDSGIVSRTVLDRTKAAMGEVRTIQELRITPDAYLASVKVSDEDLQKYYDANRKEFEEPEQVRAEFVVLSADAVRAQAKVPEADVKARYESQKAKYAGQEERRASHILIQADPGNKDARAKAKAQAEQILAQVKAKPADFAKLAKEQSQDPGSATQGGDLGFFGRGMMVKPFEDVAFSLKEKEISGVVETDFGYHVIQVTGIRATKGRSFEEVRAEIEQELKQQAGQKVYAEAADAFQNMVYEQSDSLKPVVERFKLNVEQTNWMVKDAPVMPGSPFANPKLAKAIFGDDAVKNKRNTEAVEVQPNTLVAARVLEHKAATLKSFDSVKLAIRDKLQRKQASELAVKAGEERLAELRQGKEIAASWSLPREVSRMQPQGLAFDTMKAIARVTAAPGYAGMVHPAGGYAIYKVLSINAGKELEAAAVAQIDDAVRQAVAKEEMSAYLGALRARYNVQVNAGALEKAL
jgi:peptidyl-prolyl cis-trans isomerase D